MTKRIVFDVESVGLHGEGFAVGWVRMDNHGSIIDQYHGACPIDTAAGADSDREWVKNNVDTKGAREFANPRELRDWFWKVIQDAKAAGDEIWTDCGWPVESNFLSACVADDPEMRRWGGPYPLFDVSNILLAAGLDPLYTYSRLDNELPAHNAVNDARQSARLLREAFGLLAAK